MELEQEPVVTNNEEERSETQTSQITVDETDVTSSRRVSKMPTWLNDYQSGEGLSEEEVEFAMFSSVEDPTTYEEASKEKKWLDAM